MIDDKRHHKVLWTTDYLTHSVLTDVPHVRRVGSSVGLGPKCRMEGAFGGDSHLLQITCTGLGVFEDETGTYPLSPGTAFLCRTGDAGKRYYYSPEGKGDWRNVFINFGGGDAIFRELRQRNGPIFPISADSACCRRLAEENMQGNGTHGFEVLNVQTRHVVKIALDFIQLLLESTENKQSSTPTQLYLVTHAKQLMQDNFDRGLTIGELADSLSISPEHLSRIFKQQTGQSPSQFLTKEKVSFASIRLQNVGLSVKEVAFLSGFNSSRDFIRVFKKHYGETPTTYRKRFLDPSMTNV